MTVPRLGTALSARITAVTVCAGILSTCGPGSTSQSLERELVRAAGDHRLVKPRFTGGFAYAECPVRGDSTLVTGLVCRVPNDAAARNRIRRLGSTVLDFHVDHPGPEADRLLALWSVLASERREDVERAVGDLERASRAEPGSPDLWSDLAAVRLVLADIADDPQSIVDALDAAGRALDLQPVHGPALFNKALALENLFLREAAFSAWGAYVALAPTDGWQDEAEVSRRAADTPLYDWSRDRPMFFEALSAGDANRSRLLASQYASDAEYEAVKMLATGWAFAYVERRTEAADSLWAVVSAVEEALRPVMGATVLQVALRAIRPANSVDPVKVLAHAEALVALELARREMQRSYSAAAELLTAAADRLRRLENPLSILADHELATIRYAQVDNAGFRRATDRVLQVLPSVRWNYWAAFGHRRLGTIEAAEARWNARRTQVEAALTRTHQTERAILALTYSDLAYTQLAVGGVREAWPATYQALRIVGQIQDDLVTSTVAGRAAELLASLGHAQASVMVQDAVVRATRDSGPPIRASALRRRAELKMRAGRFAAAAADIEAAARVVDSIAAPERREIANNDLTLVIGEISGERSPETAYASLPGLIEDFVAQEYWFKMSRAYLALATAQISLGAEEAAEASLIASIQEIERQGGSVSRGERASLRDKARPVFERLVLLQTRNAEVRQSFEFFEQMRSRLFVDGSPAPRPPAKEIQASLDSTTALLSFGVFEDQLLTWILTTDTLDLIEQAIPARDVRYAVDGLRAAIIGARDREARDVSARLYDWLIAPVVERHSLPEKLVLIPDRSLHYLPFAALWNEERGRYLIVDHLSVAAPAASYYAAGAGAPSAEATSPAVLAIGDPAFPMDRYAQPRLPFSEAEARAVAAAWDSDEILSGENATREAFLEDAEQANIIHFAGHAVLRPESPLDSYLLFAPDPDEAQTAEISSRDLFELELPNTELVVLSACATADGRLSETEGPISLARGFLAAGASSVISSLWPVMDESTSDFFADFHRRLSEGQASPAAALRDTQLSFLSRPSGSGAGIATWAAFQLFGVG